MHVQRNCTQSFWKHKTKRTFSRTFGHTHTHTRQEKETSPKYNKKKKFACKCAQPLVIFSEKDCARANCQSSANCVCVDTNMFLPSLNLFLNGRCAIRANPRLCVWIDQRGWPSQFYSKRKRKQKSNEMPIKEHEIVFQTHTHTHK